MTKHFRRINQKLAPQGDITVERAIAELQNEILEEVKALSDGRRTSVFQIVDLGKELLELEQKQLADLKKKAKGDLMKEF